MRLTLRFILNSELKSLYYENMLHSVNNNIINVASLQLQRAYLKPIKSKHIHL